MKSKKQSSLFKKKLTTDLVFDNLQKLATLTGKGSQDRKINLLSELLVSSKPKEAKYIVRTALEIMRIGVAEGIIRDSISKAFNVDSKIVENAWFLNADYGQIAKIAKTNGEKGLKQIKIKPGNPIVVMLGDKSPTLEDAVKKYENCILEYKYDGIRILISKDNNNFWLHTRRLEDVTSQFPDIVNLAKKSINAKSCIIEGECVGIDAKSGKSIPFQQLSRRVQRKHDIELMAKKIPVRMYLFDVLYLNGKSYLEKKYCERRNALKKIVKPIEKKFILSEGLTTKDLKKAEKFYEGALNKGYEGLMVKNLDAEYQPGRRVGHWLKIKPISEPLDLVIIGAEWGTGKRSKWFGSFELGCRDSDTGNFLGCGKLGTGLSDKQFEDLTKKLKNLIIEEKGIYVKLKPKIVIEVGYEEIQKSPKYESGFALRFPRLLRFRTDEEPEQSNDIKKIKKLFNQQFSIK